MYNLDILDYIGSDPYLYNYNIYKFVHLASYLFSKKYIVYLA